jgi:hypothetical protein
MKKDKKIREPFKPEDTPRPPQIIDPVLKSARENSGEEKKEKPSTGDRDNSGKSGLLSDQAEINDETTI